MNPQLVSRFEKFKNEANHFERMIDAPYRQPDVVAMIILAELDTSAKSLIYGFIHKNVLLASNPDVIQERATDEVLIGLIRCGLKYDMFNGDYYLYL